MKKSLISALVLGLGLTLALVAVVHQSSDSTLLPVAAQRVQAAPFNQAHSRPFDQTQNKLTVEVFVEGQWRLVGEPVYHRYPLERQIDLSSLGLSGRVRVRVRHPGQTGTHIDAVLLDGVAPSAVWGAAEEPELALRKLAAAEHDLAHATGRTLILYFDAPDRGASTLALTARIEPQHISQVPFQFPLENLYQDLSADSAFYTYAWDSARGSLTVDGDLAGEGLGQPFFKEFIEPGSGHPSGYTFAWVRNDDDTLYVALDFVPDNTLDELKDYATVYVKSPQTLKVLKTFRVSVPEQTWGQPGFVYTPRAVYQHKVYEFAIPLDELGLAHGQSLELALDAYGTVALPPTLYPGWLDATFSGDGILTTAIGTYSYGYALARQPDGKVVVAGESDNNLALARYNVNGTLDSSFGNGGIVTTSIGSGSCGQAIALQSDGKIVAAGYSDDGSNSNFALARYTPGGALDGSFGNGGIVTTSIANDSSVSAIALQADGNIVAAGSNDNNFALARYTVNGALDSSFGSGGVITTNIDGTSFGSDVALQSDGKIVLAGRSYNGGNPNFALARYTFNGTLDSSFGNGGIVTTSIGNLSSGHATAIQADGKIVLAGYSSYGSGNDFALARYTLSGTLDTSFGSSGIVTTDFGNGSNDIIQTVAIQHDGKIVVAGENSDWYFALARYNRDGSPDDSFGQAGYRVNTDVGPLGDIVQGLALGPDGKISVAGASNLGSGWGFALARYGLEKCWASIDGSTVYSSVNAFAVQQAVDAAAPGDTVKVAGDCAGTQERGGLTQVVYISKSLTLQGGYTTTNWNTPDPDAYTTTLDAGGGGRVALVTGTVAALEHLYLTGGDATGIGDSNGGGVAAYASVLTVSNSIIVSNTASNDGGGLYNYEGALVLNASSQVISNTAQDDGGGVFNDGRDYGSATLSLNDSSAVNANQAGDKGGGIANVEGAVMLTGASQVNDNLAGSQGGGINSDDDDGWGATLVLQGSSQVAGNMALYGGGLYNDDDGGGATISLNDDSQVYANQALLDGGGILNDNWDGLGRITLNDNAQVVSNTALYGGGVFNVEGALVLNANSQVISNTALDAGGGVFNYGWDVGEATTTLNANSAVSANQAYGDGGGIYNLEGLVTLNGASQVGGNTADYGSGIFNRDDGYGATLILNDDSQVWNNRATVDGGGIFNDDWGGPALVELNHNAQVFSNTADYGGGVINIEGVLNLNDNSQVFSNTANYGGGIFNWNCFNPGRVTLNDESQVYANQATLDGGGIFSEGDCRPALLNLNGNSQVVGNVAGNNGGGIHNLTTTLTLMGSSVVSGNLAGADGGGIYHSLGTVLLHGQIYNNQAGRGGGVFVDRGTLELAGGALLGNNAASDGGGVYIRSGSHSVEASVFSGNQALSCEGGGVHNSATLTIDGSTFSNNAAGSDCYGGGGLFNAGALTVTNSTFSGNQSGKYGGGIENEGDLSALAVIHSTFYGNVSSGGGGIDIFSGLLHLQNTLIANSSADSDCANYAGTIATDVNNLIEDGSCNAALVGDPLLGPLADNGGPSTGSGSAGSGQAIQTHALLAGSPALDQIPAGMDGCGTSVTSDQRGVARPQGASCDIGAYETEYFTLTVSLAGNGSGSVSGAGINCGGDCSASHPDGAVITLTASADVGSTFGGWSGDFTGTLGLGALVMTRDMSVTATFDAVIPTYTLATLVSPTLGGSVTLDPPDGVYDENTPVQLTAVPFQGYEFARWSGDLTGTLSPATITMTRDVTVTAHFEPVITPTYTLTVIISPMLGGSVTLDPPGGVYEANTLVQLTATPADGYAFAAWSGDLSGTTSVATLTMTRDVSVTASFELVQFQVYLPLVVKQ